jgi:hypothetical protein
MTDTKKYRPINERLDAINRSVQRTALTKDIDYTDLVKKSIGAYWNDSVELNEDVQNEIKSETSCIAKELADSIENPRKEFFSDFFSVILPALLSAGLILWVIKSSISLPIWLPVIFFIVAIIAAIIAVIVFVFKHDIILQHWWSFKRSGGALTSGIIVAAIFGIIGYKYLLDSQDQSLELAQTKFEKFALLSLVNKQKEGAFFSGGLHN